MNNYRWITHHRWNAMVSMMLQRQRIRRPFLSINIIHLNPF